MKKSLILGALFLCMSSIGFAQEFKVITIVESIVPGGIGRSRIIETQGVVDIDEVTTQREGDKSNSGAVKRGDLKDIGDNMKETKLLNFYSMVGIQFGNIASNDAVIGAKINKMIKDGWKLTFVVSAVESDAGKISGRDVNGGDGEGIFITRLFFSK